MHKAYGNLDPSKTPIDNRHEMVMDSQDRLVMVGDDIHNNIFIYDMSGKLLDSWGIRYKGVHGLSLWNHGEEDFLFISDIDGATIKTTLDGRKLMMIGHPSEYSAYEKEDAFKSIEMSIGPNGDIYIANGYGLKYVL